MSELVVQGSAPEIAMDNNPTPKADKTPEASSDAPFTRFIELDGRSPVPSQFRTAGTFTITRLRSPAGLPDRITKLSSVPALLVSISLKSLPSSSYQVWTADKLIPTSAVHPFRSNVIDFDAQPRCWAGCAFDYVHYSVPRKGLDDIAEDLGFGRVSDYRPGRARRRSSCGADHQKHPSVPWAERPSLRAGSRSIQPHPRSTSYPAVWCTPENGTAFKRRSGAMAEATSVGASS